MKDFWKLTRGDEIELFKAPKQHYMNKFKSGTTGRVELFYEDGILLETKDGDLIRLYEPFVFKILKKGVAE